MTRAIIYSRFSTDRQSESSITDQNRICAEFAHARGWDVEGTYADEGISGAALGNRPGVQAALAVLKRGDVLLVTDLSRLSRSQDLAPLLARLRHRGGRVIGVQDGYDSDSRTARMQAGLSGIMSEEFRSMIADRTHSALESRAKENRATGGKAYGYREGKPDKGEAFIVREIFGRFIGGEAPREIALDLNRRNIASPGSSWLRVTRRASGWMASGVRVILRNPRYTGRILWNVSHWQKDPDTGKRKRLVRPTSEWIAHQDESQRIVSDKIFAAAQSRMTGTYTVKKSGGKPKYLLSGLLRCDVCNSHYIIADALSYACSAFINGGGCTNNVRVNRKHSEAVLLDPIWKELLAEERVARLARELQMAHNERIRSMRASAADHPKELQELTARIDRLRARLRTGDPDMAADEIQAAIDRADAKRRDLLDQEPSTRHPVKVLAVLPAAAEAYRRQIAKGLEGDECEARKARLILRDLFGGEIRMVPEPSGGLVARWNLHVSALLRATGTNGSGGRI